MKFINRIIAVVLSAVTLCAYAEHIPLSLAVGPGGSNHRYAMVLQPLMNKWLNQTVSIEFRPGGQGLVAAQWLADQKDRPAFLLGGIQRDLSVNQITDIVPVLYLGADAQVIYVKTDAGVTNFRDVVKSKKTWDYGIVTANNISVQLTNYARILQGQVRFQEVLYKQAGDILRDVVGGHLDMGVSASTSIAGAVEGGRVIPVAVIGPRRSFLMPNVPTLTEQGFAWANDPYLGQAALWASPGTDKQTIELVRKNFQDWLKTTEAQDALKKLDLRLLPNQALHPEQVISIVMQK